MSNRRRKTKNQKPLKQAETSFLSPLDINPQIEEIKRIENIEKQTLKIWIIFSTKGGRRRSDVFRSYDSVIKYIQRNHFGKSDEAIRILDSRKKEWEKKNNVFSPQNHGPEKKQDTNTREYTITDTEDSNNPFTLEYIENEKKSLSGNLQDIYLGLDFGTSFTKIAYQKDINNKGILRFGEKYFKPTVVYFDADSSTFCFFRPKTNKRYRQIRFFKATMAKEETEYNALRYKDIQPTDDFEFLCSVFFLANIIRYSKKQLGQYFKCTPDLYITMGIPLFKNKTDEVIYNKVLHAAVAISDLHRIIWSMSLKDLKEITDNALKDFDNDFYDFRKDGFQNGTIPELFAESLYLLGRRDYGEGYYFIIDIGGGTADFAFIHKDSARKENTYWYYCPSRAVVPLGNEVRKAACIDKKLEEEYHDKFYKTYMPTISGGKNGLGIHGSFTVTRLMFGGGAVEPDQPYQKKERFYRRDLHFISCKVESRDNDSYRNSFFPEHSGLSPEEKQRLITASQLANPDCRNAYLSGNPWDFDTSPTKQNEAPKPEGPGYDSVG